jgi:hypothetical protein
MYLDVNSSKNKKFSESGFLKIFENSLNSSSNEQDLVFEEKRFPMNNSRKCYDYLVVYDFEEEE